MVRDKGRVISADVVKTELDADSALIDSKKEGFTPLYVFAVPHDEIFKCTSNGKEVLFYL